MWRPPVYDSSTLMVAAMSISVPITRMSVSRQDELAQIVSKGAQELSARLGHIGSIKKVS